ncbi:unnamed protein product [Polarella glacialis]|uniref:Uncharacterized protein n=1 Tax=Polarella glacialis TaxID=89957 RepID=A0A813EQC9_POLGL|nr:unnamed protein product [Polarella glacialis]
MRSSSDLESTLTKLRKLCAKKGLVAGSNLSENLGKLAEALAPSLGLDLDAATRRAQGVVKTCKEKMGADVVITPEIFFEGFAAAELGRCPVHLGFGKSLVATAMTGAMLFEGGPYEKDVPMDLDELKECVMLDRGHQKLCQVVGDGALDLQGQHHASGGRGSLVYVDYQFAEEPLN